MSRYVRHRCDFHENGLRTLIYRDHFQATSSAELWEARRNGDTTYIHHHEISPCMSAARVVRVATNSPPDANGARAPRAGQSGPRFHDARRRGSGTFTVLMEQV